MEDIDGETTPIIYTCDYLTNMYTYVGKYIYICMYVGMYLLVHAAWVHVPTVSSL